MLGGLGPIRPCPLDAPTVTDTPSTPTSESAPAPHASQEAVAPATPLGAVAIGRNEGERLKRCLTALTGAPGAGPGAQLSPVVFVDSGSTDGSADFARSIGVEVVELDMSQPFTAARARNAGYERLEELGGVDAVLFIDGDCELLEGWLPEAAALLDTDASVVAVGGCRQERHRDATAYNRLAAMEWDRPAGDADAFAGDGLVRAAAFEAVGRFNPTLIAGEEPELCVRLRNAGHRIVTLATPMSIHDAAMTRFSQWWKRAERSGHAYAEGYALHGRGPQKHGKKAVRSIAVYGVALPVVALALVVLSLVSAWWWPVAAAVALGLIYPVQALRIARGRRAGGDSAADALRYGVFTMLGKFAQLVGVGRYLRGRLGGKRQALMEYK